jgi:PAS domain S-box-containing protein
MEEGTQPARKPGNESRARTAPETPGAARVKAAWDNMPEPNPALSAGTKHGDRGTNPEMAFNLDNSQYAQIAQAIFEQSHIAVALVDLEGRIEHANHALAGLLRTSADELVGKKLGGLIHPRGSIQDTFPWGGSAPSGGQAAPMVGQVECGSGSSIECLVDSWVIGGNNCKATHFLVFIQDPNSMGNSASLSQPVHGFYRAQALRTLGMLAAGVAHDFNNALEVIIGFASLARFRLSTSDPLHEPLKIIEESAQGAAGLARQLMDISKDNPEEKGPVDTQELIGTTLSIITRTFDRKITIEQRTDSELPCVKGNHNRLQQAVLNLCINARDAMPQGGTLTIEADLQTLGPGDAKLASRCAPGSYVRIAIRDTGEGMPAEMLEKIFVPFFTTKGTGQGFGLGLAMVDWIIKEAEGVIFVTSKPGEGSEFSIYLPTVSTNIRRPNQTRPKRMISGRGGVLVVDDEPHVLAFLEKGLTRLGYDVITANSGSKACEVYARRSEEIGCVLMDLIMPGMSGLETYSRLKDINPRVRVILSSGYSSGRIRSEAAEVGTPEFLEKPFTLEELSQAMQKVQKN